MTTKLTIQGFELEFEAPYKEGDVLNANEAAAINQTFGENLRNNFAAIIKTKRGEIARANDWFADDEKKVPDLEKVTDEMLQEEFDVAAEFSTYAENYEFGARRAGGTRTVVDPVEKAARNIAWEKVKGLLKARNYKLTDVDKDMRERLVGEALEKFPEIKDEAERQVSAAKSISLDGLSI
ncbi:MAG: hypothetical protein B7Z37_02970 [Verrucomicrobia bacterium 12-59-8]|nr:MAG: hypothetical protein B7Z37_02970 [Verrucomicrobia bacterium 12-59-8]